MIPRFSALLALLWATLQLTVGSITLVPRSNSLSLSSREQVTDRTPWRAGTSDKADAKQQRRSTVQCCGMCNESRNAW
jgi:hypothetical protein